MCAFLFLIALTATFSYAQKSDSLTAAIEVEDSNVVETSHISMEEIKAEEIQPQEITITNAIQPNMLAYKHWTGTYDPDAFTVFVNDTEVAQGAALKISAETKTVNLKFDYSFVNGMRKGSKSVSYTLNENITQANITFSWDSDNKIMLDNGTAAL